MSDNKTFLRFKKLLRFVFENKYSDFYRLKYEKAGFSPLADFNSIKDIKKIPFLAREELARVDPLKLLFVKEEKVNYISQTSGTTGEPVLCFTSSPYPNRLSKDDFPFTRSINFGRILLLGFPFRILHLNYFVNIKGRNPLRLAGDVHNIPASLKSASKLKVNTIVTSPSLAIILKDYLEHYPDLKKSLKFLLLGGELVSSSKKKFLKELYPDLESVLVYNISEIPSLLASQCSFLAQRTNQIYYHPSSFFHLEIIDPFTEGKVEFQKRGELVVTNFYNPATPIIRYKTGDLVSFKENNCPCGYPGPILEILGRAKYDLVKVGGVELKKERLETPILNLKDYLEENFEVHVYENFVGTKPKIRVTLNLSLKKGVKESPKLKQKIENELLENWQLSPRLNLRKAVEGGLFEPLQINFIQFPRATKTRQILILH